VSIVYNSAWSSNNHYLARDPVCGLVFRKAEATVQAVANWGPNCNTCPYNRLGFSVSVEKARSLLNGQTPPEGGV